MSELQFDYFITLYADSWFLFILVLSLFSKFFNHLFTRCPVEERLQPSPQLIILPSYSTDIITAFVQFFYTGEALIAENSINEFILLCRDFNCDEIPALQNILQMKTEVVKQETENFQAAVIDASVQDDADTVESIFFQIESHQMDEMDASSVKEEYLNEEYIEDADENPGQYDYVEIEDDNKPSQQFPLKQSASRNISSLTRPRGITKSKPPVQGKVFDIRKLQADQERFKKSLQEAVNAVRDGIDTLEIAAMKFNVPRSAIERNLKNYKKTETW